MDLSNIRSSLKARWLVNFAAVAGHALNLLKLLKGIGWVVIWLISGITKLLEN